MKYIYNSVAIPGGTGLLPEINSAAGRLKNKIDRLDLSSLGLSEYNQRYLGQKLSNPVECFQLYCHMLSLSLAGNTKPLDKFVFVDYGGGSGLLSLLAKELGIGRVIYNDIYDVSCKDAEILAAATGHRIDDNICGDIDDLIKYLELHNIIIDAISSYDVIEHIYDIEAYFRKLKKISDTHYRVVFGSAANMRNPRLRKGMEKNHLECEHKDKEKQWGHKERDALKSFLNIRKEIIAGYAPDLPAEDVDLLASGTRGLIKEDIEKCVDEYRGKGSISYRPDHPTNTCDPYTGNWAEHLMEPEWIEKILGEEGFEVRTLSGFYAYVEKFHIRFIKNILNIVIKLFGKAALPVSPYYVIFADYRPRN